MKGTGMVELETCRTRPRRSKFDMTRRARWARRLEEVSHRRSGNTRLRSNRWCTENAYSFSEGRHRPTCAMTRSEAHRRMTMPSWLRSNRSCALLGTAIMAVIASSGTGFASARIVGMQQAVSDVNVPRTERIMQPRRLDACSSDSDCEPNEAEQSALDDDNMNIFCDEACEDTGSDPFGGIWCDFLGKESCRACDVFDCVGTLGDCYPCSGDIADVAPTDTPVVGATENPVDVTDLVFTIPPNAIEATSCTTATCEDSADADDIDYLNENDLTLYCDSKCADTGSDIYGGLWCNMRGLGQLCRACRADNCEDWDVGDTCVPCDEVQETLPPSITPAPSDLTPSPFETEVPLTPVPSEIAPTVVPIATDAPMVTVSPVTTIAPEATVVPTATIATVVPTATIATVVPTATIATVVPTATIATVVPTATLATVVPTATMAPGATVVPTATLAPGVTVVPTGTLAPGATVVPTATTAPGATVVPTATLAPGVTVVPTGTLAPGATVVPTATTAPRATVVPTATLAPGVTVVPTGTLAPGATVVPTGTLAPGATVVPTATTAPGATVVPIATLAPGATVVPTATTAPGATVVPTATTAPGATVVPTATTAPGATLVPTGTLAPGATLVPTGTLAPGATIVPTATLAPGVTVAPSTTTAPGATVVPTATLAPGATPSPVVTPVPSFGMNITVTMSPSSVTVAPSMGPTSLPSGSPTVAPTGTPTLSPTFFPTGSPTFSPTGSPTFSPTGSPTFSPTGSPTFSPTGSPTAPETMLPSGSTVNSSTMKAVVGLIDVSGTTREDLQDGLKTGFEEALSTGDGSNITVSVNIDSTNFSDDISTSRRIRGRRGLQAEECSVVDDTCDVEAIVEVTFEGDSGSSSADGVDSLSKKENFAKIGTEAGVDASDVTLTSLKVSANPDDEVIDAEDSELLVGQTVVTSSDSKSINYWLFSLTCALILLLWMCCLVLAWQRYRNTKDEQAADESARSSRWGGERYGGPPSPAKGADSIEGDKMKDSSIIMHGEMDLKRQEKLRAFGDSGESHLGLHSGLEDIPEESGSSNSRDSVTNQGPHVATERVVADRSGPKSSWGYESSEPNRDSFKSGRAVPSGRQVLSRGKQRSTGSSTFSDELVGQQRGSQAVSRDTFDGTSEDMDNRTSNTSGGISGSGGISSSFTSSAGVTSSTFDDDDDGEGNEEDSSDFENMSSGGASERTRRTGLGGSGEGAVSFADLGAGILRGTAAAAAAE